MSDCVLVQVLNSVFVRKTVDLVSKVRLKIQKDSEDYEERKNWLTCKRTLIECVTMMKEMRVSQEEMKTNEENQNRKFEEIKKKKEIKKRLKPAK